MNTTLNTYIQNQIIRNPMNIKEELAYNNIKFNTRLDFDRICEYIDDFLMGNNINRYILLPGIRGVGKSTMLFQTYEYLLKTKNVNPQNILYISSDNLKQMCNSSILDAVTSYLDIYHHTIFEAPDEPVFLLIDEAQYDKDWALTGKIIFDSTKSIFMIFSGSRALELTYNADAARRLLKFPVTPLNYPEHLRLKYGNFKNDISPAIAQLIFDGKTEGISEIDTKMAHITAGFKNFDVNEWNDFLKFGGFPSSFFQKPHEVSEKIMDKITRAVTIDMKNIEGLNGQTQDLAFQLLYFFALQNPGEISKGSMANHLDSNKITVNKILNTLEKTQLIFQIPPLYLISEKDNKTKQILFCNIQPEAHTVPESRQCHSGRQACIYGQTFRKFCRIKLFQFGKQKHDNLQDIL